MSAFSQFEIKTLIPIKLLGNDISFTNSAMWMCIGVCTALFLLLYSLKDASIIPDRKQSFTEMIYGFIYKTLTDNTGEEGKKYFPLIFTIFIFVLTANCLGMVPYSFTTTSHLIVTFSLAITIFVIINIIAFAKHGLHFFHFFLPKGLPIVLAPMMVIIELFGYLTRPISLSIRLAANMMVGHILLKVIAGFVGMLGIIYGIIPIPFMVLFNGFEIFVAILQAYIFTILTCVYLNDALNMH